MAAEIAEFTVGIAGEDFATVAAEEFDGGFGSARSGLRGSGHAGFGFGWGFSKVQLRI